MLDVVQGRIRTCVAAPLIGRSGIRWSSVGGLAGRSLLSRFRDLAAAAGPLTRGLHLIVRHDNARQDGGIVVGLASNRPAIDDPTRAELAYYVNRCWRRRGIATTAVACLLVDADTVGFDRVIAETRSVNVASQRVLLRSGFVLCDCRDDPVEGKLWQWEKPLNRGVRPPRWHDPGSWTARSDVTPARTGTHARSARIASLSISKLCRPCRFAATAAEPSSPSGWPASVQVSRGRRRAASAPRRLPRRCRKGCRCRFTLGGARPP